MKKIISNFFRIRKYKKRFYEHYKKYQQTQISTNESYIVFRSLFVLSKGKLNDDLSKTLAREVGKYSQIENNGVLGSNDSFAEKVYKMRNDGFYIFDSTLNQNTLQAIFEYAQKTPVSYSVDTRGFHKGKDLLKGKRLLFQIQFTNSLFGQSYEKVDYKLIDSKYSDYLTKYNYTYSNIC